MNKTASSESKFFSSAVKKTLLSFALSGVLFGIVAYLVTSGTTKPFDQAALLWINQHASPAFDSFFLAITDLGGVIILAAATLAIVLYLLVKKKYPQALLLAAGVGGVSALNVLLKTLFDRPRPDLWDWLITETSFSFPSGHSAASFAFALCIILLLWNTKWRIISTVIAGLYIVLIGTSRLYLGVHYPTDVLGGWLLAFTWVMLVTGLIYMYWPNAGKRKA